MSRPPMPILRTGGQTGVDRAVLDFALSRDLPYLGWCPKGGWAEDLPDPPGLLRRYPKPLETPSDDPRQRTAWNVRDAAATLLLTRGPGTSSTRASPLPGGPTRSGLGPDLVSPGTEFTQLCAELLYSRPWFVVRLDSRPPLADLVAWLAGLSSREGRPPFELNIAGPRESEAPCIYEATGQFLQRLFA